MAVSLTLHLGRGKHNHDEAETQLRSVLRQVFHFDKGLAHRQKKGSNIPTKKTKIIRHIM